MKTFLASLTLLTLVHCVSLSNGVSLGLEIGNSIMPLIIFTAESSSLGFVSSAYHDSTGSWPSERMELGSFYEKEEDKFMQDSLFQKLNFNEQNFKSLIFNNLNDTLKISFNTIPLPDSSYFSKYLTTSEKPTQLSFYDFTGFVKVYKDSTSDRDYNTDSQLDSFITYDSNMKEIGHPLIDYKKNSLRSWDKN